MRSKRLNVAIVFGACVISLSAPDLRAETEQERGLLLIDFVKHAALTLNAPSSTARYCAALLRDLLALKIHFVEPVVETDQPDHPTLSAVVGHCAAGSPYWHKLPTGVQQFAVTSDLGDAGYRLYRPNKEDSRYVVFFAKVQRGREVPGPPFRMTGYSAIDKERCVIGSQVHIRDEQDLRVVGAVAKWHSRLLLVGSERYGRQPSYTYDLRATAFPLTKRENREQPAESCYWQ